MDKKPFLSYSAKTLIFESLGPEASRRDFLKAVTVLTVAGAILSIPIDSTLKQDAEAVINCCYSNCFNECHSDCGRKSW